MLGGVVQRGWRLCWKSADDRFCLLSRLTLSAEKHFLWTARSTHTRLSAAACSGPWRCAKRARSLLQTARLLQPLLTGALETTLGASD